MHTAAAETGGLARGIYSGRVSEMTDTDFQVLWE